MARRALCNAASHSSTRHQAGRRLSPARDGGWVWAAQRAGLFARIAGGATVLPPPPRPRHEGAWLAHARHRRHPTAPGRGRKRRGGTLGRGTRVPTHTPTDRHRTASTAAVPHCGRCCGVRWRHTPVTRQTHLPPSSPPPLPPPRAHTNSVWNYPSRERCLWRGEADVYRRPPPLLISGGPLVRLRFGEGEGVGSCPPARCLQQNPALGA